MNLLFLPLYIDPGTGSMLFSILIGALASLFFLGKALILKIKLFISKDKSALVDKSYKKFVIYCEDKRYWTVFLPILDEFERRKIELTYFTSVKNDLVFNQNYTYVKPEYIGEGNKAFAKLNMLNAGFVLMTTPGLQVYQLKRSKNVNHYSHIFHSTTDPTTYRLFGIDYFDSILLTGDYQVTDIRTLEKMRDLPAKELVTVGCTYLDVLKERISLIPDEENHPFTVLVSPSWGTSGLLLKYGQKLLDPLVKTGWRIIVRPHPQSRISEKEMLDELTTKYADDVIWDYEQDNIYSLKKADIMISDFSGIIYDYTFLCDKPVMYVNADMDLRPYDAFDINEGKDIWQLRTLKKMGIELKEEEFPNIKTIIQNASDSKELFAARAQAKSEGWMNIGESAKRTVDYMIQNQAEKTI